MGLESLVEFGGEKSGTRVYNWGNGLRHWAVYVPVIPQGQYRGFNGRWDWEEVWGQTLKKREKELRYQIST